MEATAANNNAYEYDLKYSRLLAVLEHKGLRALQTSKILIVGMRGLGIEIGTKEKLF
jgi:molybdopterin/thiamine biosynthesis adenylyltransferase